MKINPSGSSFALLTRKDQTNRVSIHDLWETEKKLHEFNNLYKPQSICYTPDAKNLIVGTEKFIFTFDARTYTIKDRMSIPFAAHLITVSPNGYYLIRKEFEINLKNKEPNLSDNQI